MISLVQLQKLRELINATVTKMETRIHALKQENHTLKQENTVLCQKLAEYKENLEQVCQTNCDLAQNQQLVEVEFNQLMTELQELQLDVESIPQTSNTFVKQEILETDVQVEQQIDPVKLEANPTDINSNSVVPEENLPVLESQKSSDLRQFLELYHQNSNLQKTSSINLEQQPADKNDTEELIFPTK